MPINWRFFVPNFVDIDIGLLELFENVAGVRFFLRHSVYGTYQKIFSSSLECESASVQVAWKIPEPDPVGTNNTSFMFNIFSQLFNSYLFTNFTAVHLVAVQHWHCILGDRKDIWPVKSLLQQFPKVYCWTSGLTWSNWKNWPDKQKSEVTFENKTQRTES